MIDTIVVGVDRTQTSLAAARFAALTASREDAEIVVASVCDTTASTRVDQLVVTQDVEDDMIEQATAAAAAAVEVIRETAPAVPVRSTVAGNSDDADVDVAAALLSLGEQASMIVVGTRGRGAIASAVGGSVSDTVAAKAPRRAAVITADGGHGPVVVGVDDSPHADTVLVEALRQAAHRDTHVIAVHTWAPVTAGAFYGVGYAATAQVDQMGQQAHDFLDERLDRLGDSYPDVDVERVVQPQGPGPAILDAAGEDAALIVIGSRGRGHLASLVLGSTSQHILHHTELPVLVVH